MRGCKKLQHKLVSQDKSSIKFMQHTKTVCENYESQSKKELVGDNYTLKLLT